MTQALRMAAIQPQPFKSKATQSVYDFLKDSIDQVMSDTKSHSSKVALLYPVRSSLCAPPCMLLLLYSSPSIPLLVLLTLCTPHCVLPRVHSS